MHIILCIYFSRTNDKLHPTSTLELQRNSVDTVPQKLLLVCIMNNTTGRKGDLQPTLTHAEKAMKHPATRGIYEGLFPAWYLIKVNQ